jgi:hypothetical protein
MTTQPIETRVDTRLPSKAWIIVEQPDRDTIVVAGSEAAVEEALAYPGTSPARSRGEATVTSREYADAVARNVRVT